MKTRWMRTYGTRRPFKRVASVLALLAGCSLVPPREENPTVIITDMGGVEVAVPRNIEQVVCVSNPGVDMMLALGAGDTLIGAHKSVMDNPWAKEFLPDSSRLTFLDSYAPEAEGLIAMNADVVFLTSEEPCEVLRDKGVCAVCLRFYSLEETKRAVALLGEMFGGTVAEKGGQWLAELESVISETNDKLSGVTEGERPVVYEIMGDKYRGLYRTPYGDTQGWIACAGGEIATKEFAGMTSSNTPMEEAILATNPDVILLSGQYWSQLKQDLLSDEKWASVNAVVNGEIYNIPIAFVSWGEGSCAYPLMIQYLHSILYPSQSDWLASAPEDVQSFYQKYYGISFSEEKVAYMLNTLGPDGENLC